MKKQKLNPIYENLDPENLLGIGTITENELEENFSDTTMIRISKQISKSVSEQSKKYGIKKQTLLETLLIYAIDDFVASSEKRKKIISSISNI